MSKEVKVTSRKHYYEMLVRDGNILPSLRSPFTSIEYLYGIQENLYWCPHQRHLTIRNCFTPPSSKYLVTEVNRIL